MGFTEGAFPIKYLGVPLSPRRFLHNDYDTLVLNMVNKIQCWNHKHLSYVGMLVVLKSVLYCIQNFWAKLFPFPVGVSRRITSILRNYLWSGSAVEKKTLVVWASLCQERCRGCLEISEVLS